MEYNLSKLSHEELADLAQKGNETAEEFLIREYKDFVRTKARAYFIIGAGGEDVVQEGMIGLFKAIKSFSKSKEASFKTYASLCINRQILDAIKAASRKKHSPLNTSVSLNKKMKETSQTLEETIAGVKNDNPEKLLEEKDLIAFISNNKKGIFSDFEVQVWNRYMDGKKYNEIAKDLDKKTKDIYNAIERIKRKTNMHFNE